MARSRAGRSIAKHGGMVGCALMTSIWMLGSGAMAQSTQPGSTLEDQFAQPRLPESKPPAPFKIEQPRSKAVASAATTAFDVRRIVVDGATSIATAQIEALTAPLEGQSLTLADLAGLADRITALYAREGYALSFALVPEQTVIDGVVHIRVVEGTLAEWRVVFANGAPLAGKARIESAIERRLRSLVGAGPVRSSELERALLAIDDLAGIEASVVIKPSASTEGAADLVVVIESTPIEATVGIDNRLRAEFGHEEIVVALEVNSVALVGDRIAFSARNAVDFDAFSYVSVGYQAPVGLPSGTAFASFSTARTGAKSGILGLLEFTGREQSHHLGTRQPLLRSRARSLYLTADLDGVDTRSRLLGTTVVRDKVRTLALGVDYDWADGGGATSLVSARFLRGLAGLGATDDANPLRSRAFGRAESSFINFRLYRDQKLTDDFRLRIAGEAQYTVSSRSLLAASECSYGGPAIGRGYDAGTISGDHCLLASAEFARPISASGVVIEPYVYGDLGFTRQNGPLEVSERRKDEGYSYGAGVRLFSQFGVSADLQLSQRTGTSARQSGDDTRIFFSLSLQR